MRFALVLLASCSGATIDPVDASSEPAPQPDAAAGEASELDAGAAHDAAVEVSAPVYCYDFAGVKVDAQAPIACTGTNWSFDSVNGAALGPCRDVTCPTMQGEGCSLNGVRGVICCPAMGCP